MVEKGPGSQEAAVRRIARIIETLTQQKDQTMLLGGLAQENKEKIENGEAKTPEDVKALAED